MRIAAANAVSLSLSPKLRTSEMVCDFLGCAMVLEKEHVLSGAYDGLPIVWEFAKSFLDTKSLKVQGVKNQEMGFTANEQFHVLGC